MALRVPVGGTLGCSSMVLALGIVKRLPGVPAASSIAAWPHAMAMLSV